jgi:transposase
VIEARRLDPWGGDVIDYKVGTPRSQIFLFQLSLEELIERDNIVRFIDAYVESLDMGKLGFRMHENRKGAPAYRPQVKLKIYIYGYFNRIRSSRLLEAECKRNREMIWLVEGLKPDFKTIADFRRDNPKALKNVFKEFVLFCHKMGLISMKLLAVDGTKLRGQNGRGEVYRREKLEEIERAVEKGLERYFEEMEELDRRQDCEGIQIRKAKVVELTKKIQRLTRKREKVNAAKEFLETHPEENAYSGSDQDSRLQKDKGMVQPGYNAQSVVDGQNKLIVAAEVSNQQTDKRLLGAMVEQAIEVKKGLGIEENSEMVADAGYFNETEVLAHQQEQGIRVTVPIAAEGEREHSKEKLWGQEKFCYDAEQDMWVCPLGTVLRRITAQAVADKNGRMTWKYQADEAACAACLKKSCCTKGRGGRMLRVSVRHRELKGYFEQLENPERKALIKKRKELVEHPFGTIKRTLGFGHFLQRGIEAVGAEFQFSCLIYDLKRVLNLVPLGKLMEAVGR